MTDLEISKALAMAIGWPHVTVSKGKVYVNLKSLFDWGNAWRSFDYCDWNVIGPIAARYALFPEETPFKWQRWLIRRGDLMVCADSPQKAIAMAVILGARK